MRTLLSGAILSLFLNLAPCVSAAEPLYRGGVVATDHPLASEAGAEMLRRGGNAVDAAVAASFALSVVRPYSCGLGGGGFMVVFDPRAGVDDAVALDYRETAPRAMGPDYFASIEDPFASRFGGSAVGTPGTVAGLLQSLDRYGTLSREEVLAPAIRFAQEGFAADAHYVASAQGLVGWFQQHPGRTQTHARLWTRFLKKGTVSEGDVIRLPGQADALALIAERGAEAFYVGPIGEAVVRAVRSAEGALEMDDLTDYAPKMRTPLQFSHRGMTFLAMPPPSSGGVAMGQALNILSAWESAQDRDVSSLGQNSADYAHLIAEALQHAFADRAEWLADSDFEEVPVERLTSDAYAASLASRIEMERTLAPREYGSRAPAPADSGTSHISVVDADGMAVSCTETINLVFGSRICVEPYDFFLNNEIDDFTTRRGQANAFGLRQSEKNLPAPGKKPLSSMSPTIVFDSKSGVVELVAGASGGPRIISGTLQVMLNALLFDMSASEAVAAPRFHHQWLPSVLMLEPHWTIGEEGGGAMSLDEVQRMMDRVGSVRAFRRALESKGHRLSERSDVGVVQLIRRRDDGYEAASDPRKGGSPAGIR